MTTPLPDPEQLEPDSVVQDAPVVVTPAALDAAKAELEQLARDAKAGVWSRTWRTLAQGVVSAAGLAALDTVYQAVHHGSTDPKGVLLLAGSAALTAVVTFVHNKLKPVG